MSTMAHLMPSLPLSPKLSSFPLSSSRGTRQLPVPSAICTTLPPLPTPPAYQPRSQVLVPEPYYAHGSGDSYFPLSHSNPASIPSTAASTPAPPSFNRGQSPPRVASSAKRTSISSLLSTPENSGSDSEDVSPNCWSAGTSPTTAGTSTRSNSLVSTPVSATPSSSGICYSPPGYTLGRRSSAFQEEEGGEYATGPARKKGRSTPRTTSTTESANRDEYDVLGRKKPKTPRTPMSWDPKDDILLKQLKEEQRLGWKEIATHFPGRTSHACQFRWRRLASGQLKYYQGHRRPPAVTTTSRSFANEMASTPMHNGSSTSPKVLMNGMNVSQTVAASNQLQQNVHQFASEPRGMQTGHGLYQPIPQPAPWVHPKILQPNFHQPTPLPSPDAFSPRALAMPYVPENWTPQEDAILLDGRLTLAELNVVLRGRSENEIKTRKHQLEQLHGLSHRSACHDEYRRGPDLFGGRIPGIETVGGFR